ncbi:TPA: glutathione peroxidase [Streptococcus suis]|nr:glutathione peroxidase [Streptococcus suis]
MKNIYDFSLENQDGQPVSLEDYKGKVLLLVNTASGCGLTPQYEELQDLYDRYQQAGLEILDIPCNQFMNQAPGTAQEINQFCQLHYGTSFPRFAKIKVNGAGTHPLYKWLKEQARGPLGRAIEWNFVKFLVDREGRVVKRFAAMISPEKIEEHIQVLLAK